MRLKAQQKSDREDGIMGIFGLSQYAAVDPRNLVPISRDVPFELAALSEPVACAVASASKLDIELGQTVVVIGAGAMGMANILVAKSLGAFVVVSRWMPPGAKELWMQGLMQCWIPIQAILPNSFRRSMTDV